MEMAEKRVSENHPTNINGHSTNGSAGNNSHGKICKNGVSDASPASTYSSKDTNGSHGNGSTHMNGTRVSNGVASLATDSKQKQTNGNDGSQVYFDLKQPLPKLPVPDLNTTLHKYLTLLKTVTSPGEYAQTRRIVEEFLQPDADGPKLQDYLLRRQQERDNWANEYWLYDMYLNIRLPLIINSNPAAVFRRMTFFTSEDQINGNLPVERCSQRENGRPMCMDQHTRLISSSRLPGRTIDVQTTNTKDIGNEFIVVACQNQFFRINVQHNNIDISESSLVSQMTHAKTIAELSSNQQPIVGMLTSQSRDVWSQQRNHLMEDATNRSCLSELENSMCLVCLDEGGLGKDMTSRTHHVLHGGGSSKNTGNRWMDKAIQIIVSEDGTCGVNLEHSTAEGIALGHMIEHAFTFMSKDPKDTADPPCPRDTTPTLPTQLTWNLSSQTVVDIQGAVDEVDRLIDDFDLSVIHFKEFGREFIKSQRMSPDAFIQLALQLTYFKIHNSLSSTYESASVRRFRHGRVDVIRANSPAALAWIKSLLGIVESTEETKLQLMRTAIEWQQEYTQDTIMGHGVDLHLVGLREAAVDLGMPTPALFTDPSFNLFNYFNLSTSQVMTVSDYWMSYGAVVPEGYGCCYNPKSKSIIFSVASFFSCPDTSSDMFTASLESSLNQMAELCTNVMAVN